MTLINHPQWFPLRETPNGSECSLSLDQNVHDNGPLLEDLILNSGSEILHFQIIFQSQPQPHDP